MLGEKEGEEGGERQGEGVPDSGKHPWGLKLFFFFFFFFLFFFLHSAGLNATSYMLSKHFCTNHKLVQPIRRFV